MSFLKSVSEQVRKRHEDKKLSFVTIIRSKKTTTITVSLIFFFAVFIQLGKNGETAFQQNTFV
jgi:hypothetical protein